jgi:hypothetical protein
MEKEKNVTIPEEFFVDLVKHFLAGIRLDEDRIRLRLQEKLDTMVKRVQGKFPCKSIKGEDKDL